jgi:AcrR family transcriptional regulator
MLAPEISTSVAMIATVHLCETDVQDICATLRYRLAVSGNRDALLAGALKCIYEKGYARTTARDIASAAGTSLAAIGYHFGTTQQLLNHAVFAAAERWGDEMQARIQADARPPQTYLDRFTAIITETIGSIHDERPMWESMFDVLGQTRHVPEIHELLRDGLHAARTGNVAMFDGVDEDTVDERQERTLGAFYYSLTVGMAVQWLLDPEGAPTAEDVAEALRTIAARMDEAVENHPRASSLGGFES